MGFLAKIGIDWKLLIAQMVNFGILLWLLDRLLYKPIIRETRRQEEELGEAKAKEKELERQDRIFQEQRKKIMADSQQQVKDILSQARKVSKQMEKEALEKGNREAEMMINQAKVKIKSLEPEIQIKILEKVKGEIRELFSDYFLKTFSPDIRQEIEDILWKNLIKQLKIIPINEGNRRGIEQNKYVTIEFVHPLTLIQKKELEELGHKKTKSKISLVERENKKLICGFRLEIMGFVIESNLSNIVNGTIKGIKV